MPRTPSAEEGDFWADQSAFAADMARLQQRRAPQPSSARSGAASSGRGGFEPDMDDVWAEQAAFEAEVAALQDGDQPQQRHAEEDQAGGGDGVDADEDMWRDLAAFEAEMEQLHSEAPYRGSSAGKNSSFGLGLNPNAASFNAAGFTAASNPPANGDAEKGRSAAVAEHSGHEQGLTEALDEFCIATGESASGPVQGLCPQHRAAGDCTRGASCPFAHGDLCEVLNTPFDSVTGSSLPTSRSES